MHADVRCSSAGPSPSPERPPRSAPSAQGEGVLRLRQLDGGVNRRKVEYRYYDDAYNPAQTVQLTRKLVEQDHVFAIFNAIGTANNLAIRDYLNAQKVPQLFAGDGSQALGGASARYPWNGRFLPSYRGEGAVVGRDLVATRPKAKVAVLLENTELGKDMTRGLSRAIARKRTEDRRLGAVRADVDRRRRPGRQAEGVRRRHAHALRDAEVHDPGDRRGEEARVEAAALPRFRLDRADDHGDRAGERPDLTLGARAIAFVKNPNDPIWRKDTTVALYRSILRRFAPSAKWSDVYNWYGMTVAWTMVDTLRRAGKNLTRATLLRAARSLDTTRNPFLLPGTRLRTSATDAFPIDTVYLYRYDNRQWVRTAGPFPAR